jgi:hypothetical protein
VGVFSLGPYLGYILYRFDTLVGYHFTLFAQYAALSLPLAILEA